MKNQVYERVFKKLDAKRQKDLEEAEEEDDGTVDIRSDFLRQQRYVKYQECATFLWDSFTLGAKSKNAANEEKDKEDQARLDREKNRKGKKFGKRRGNTLNAGDE